MLELFNQHKALGRAGVEPPPLRVFAKQGMGLHDPELDHLKAQFDALNPNKQDRVKLGEFKAELQHLVNDGLLAPNDVPPVLASLDKLGYALGLVGRCPLLCAVLLCRPSLLFRAPPTFGFCGYRAGTGPLALTSFPEHSKASP